MSEHASCSCGLCHLTNASTSVIEISFNISVGWENILTVGVIYITSSMNALRWVRSSIAYQEKITENVSEKKFNRIMDEFWDVSSYLLHHQAGQGFDARVPGGHYRLNHRRFAPWRSREEAPEVWLSVAGFDAWGLVLIETVTCVSWVDEIEMRCICLSNGYFASFYNNRDEGMDRETKMIVGWWKSRKRKRSEGEMSHSNKGLYNISNTVSPCIWKMSYDSPWREKSRYFSKCRSLGIAEWCWVVISFASF